MTLFFDLDDTLVNSAAAYDEGLRALGLEPNDPIFLEARKQVKEVLGAVPSARSRILYLKRYLELSSGYTPIHHLEILKKYEDSVCSFVKKQWLELKRDVLFSNLSLKHQLYIVTNETTRMQSLKMLALDPHFKYFSGMITSEEAGVEKPNLKIFQLALLRSRAEVHNSYMIGDSIENDIQPAIQMGMNAIHTYEFLSATAPTATAARRVAKLDQILEMIFQ